MKKQVRNLFLAGMISLSGTTYSQVVTSTIDDYTLSPNSYYNGSTGGNGFSSGSAFFPTVWDTAWSYWAGGWAASSMTDSVTSGPTNIYSAKTAGGNGGSANYAIGTQGSVIQLTGAATGDSVQGIYVTNTTYAYNSMRDGDAFAKKFGGASGNDPDWFLLTIKKYYGGTLSSDSVSFYLADYRFSNNANDYILGSWAYVNLKPLGMADSLAFFLSSSDTGAWGMNTPAFFAIDDFSTKASIVGMNEQGSSAIISSFPNPAVENLNIALQGFAPGEKVQISIFELTGKLISEVQSPFSALIQTDVSGLAPGSYILRASSPSVSGTLKFIKK